MVQIETDYDKQIVKENIGLAGVPCIMFSFPKKQSPNWQLYNASKCLENIGPEVPNSRLVGVLNRKDLDKQILALINKLDREKL